jgi:methylmalonyl-CoA/ethylmalonyl-CoA epimerase
MAKLRHITLSTDDLEGTAKFYVGSFGMKTHAQQAHAVRMSDGVVNLTLIKYRDDEHAGDERGTEFYGIHHIGFEVDDLDEAGEKIKASGGTLQGERANEINVEQKFKGPNGVVIDIARMWQGTS